jgi:ATP-dependent Lon protease
VEPHEKVTLTDASIMDMINHYCGHEAGVRNLRKAIDRVFRKIVSKLEISEKKPSSDSTAQAEESALAEVHYQINTKNLEKFLDIPPTDDAYFFNINKQLPVGSSNGLAYVNDGYGVVMKIQIVKRLRQMENEDGEKEKAQTGKFTTTGRLGEVFSESVEVVKIAVFNFLHAEGLAKDFDKDSYHLHVPMGATPKDGPSAGVSLFSALVSSATDKPVAANLAMTGEITTLGEVISIGGVREKLTACKNHNISRVALPMSNKKHVKKLPEEFKKGFTIYYVQNIRQLYNVAFGDCDASSHSTDAERLAFNEKLKQLGVEIEEYESDDFHKVVFEREDIMKGNELEQIF